MLLSTVDVVFADIAQPDQARIVTLNADWFLRDQGHVVISMKASCIDSTIPPELCFAKEVQVLKENRFKPIEQVPLEPYERDHAMVSGGCLAFCLFILEPISSILFLPVSFISVLSPRPSFTLKLTTSPSSPIQPQSTKIELGMIK